MGKLHLIILKCGNNHSFGGTTYINDKSGMRAQAINHLRSVVTNATHYVCPICRDKDFHFYDEETPFESIQDEGAKEFLDNARNRCLDEADNPNIAVIEMTGLGKVVLNDDGTVKDVIHNDDQISIVFPKNSRGDA